ncbi:NifU family protein [Simkania sp.]|uniref:NifU family protein n=1 Tax=Simkania sp. TaxID=34094 RepID=UPI003B52CDA5
MNPYLKPYPWAEYSNLLVERILAPRNVGFFSGNKGAQQEMRVVSGESQDGADENHVIFYLVVDETDGIIADVKFQAFGESPLIGAADAICDIILRKNYDQARRLTAELVDKKLRDFDHTPAFPESASHHLNLALEALDIACEKCLDIPISDPSYSPPVPSHLASTGEYPEWDILSFAEKLELIRKVVQEEVQPYIELDAGGIEVPELKNDNEVVIAYQGACTTCPSSTGATLSAIQEILRARVHPNLTVKPDLSLLSF